MDIYSAILKIAVLIMSVVIHEFSHGYVAYLLGDPTAKNLNRLTLNPIRHLDFFGSLIVPLMLYLSSAGAIVFGWAKPVPFNPYNLKDQRYGVIKVAVAGPTANLFMAFVFGLILRLIISQNILLSDAFLSGLVLIILINLLLAIFNLVPIPPLDGFKILFGFLPTRFENVKIFLERYGIFIFLIFIFYFVGIISPIISLLFWLITGRSI